MEAPAANPALTEIRVEQKDDLAIVYGGATPIIALAPADAALAGEASLAIHATAVAAKIRAALADEHTRGRVARGVFSFSLVVLSALLLFLMLGRLQALLSRARAFMRLHPERLSRCASAGIDVVRPKPARRIADRGRRREAGGAVAVA